MTSEAGLYDDALVIFFAEAREMLTQIEDSLLALESDPSDEETVNGLFRAAHTIKGSAGLFGLDRVVKFTHHVESVLERVRSGELKLEVNLNNVLLKSRDVIEHLLALEESKSDDPALLAQLDADAALVVGQISGYLGKHRALDALSETVSDPVTPPIASAWHISLRFSTEAFRNGFDPLSVVRYLGTLGEIVAMLTIDDNLPTLADLDPESCHLGFEIRLQSNAGQDAIEGAFEFVRDDCAVRVFPPNRRASDFIGLLAELPGETRLGELLVEVGALSREALDAALAEQAAHTAIHPEHQTPLGDILVQHHTVAREVVDAALEKQHHIPEPHQQRQPEQRRKGRQDGGQWSGQDGGQSGAAQTGRPAREPVEADDAAGQQARPLAAREPRNDESRFVRVPADKLDELINLVGELVICGASASLLAVNLREQALIETTQQMSTLIEEIRNGTLALRMVQIGETFARFRRVVRDTAVELGKEIHLEIEGAETELDKSVVEKIGDPLMHLVRNAMDHGIETPQQRLEAGKESFGTLHMSAHHDSGHIVIEVRDDGRGLDGEKLLQKARERGLVTPTQILSDSEKLNLIFEPGFSTAEKVTNLSGRGVGMDVVKRNIEALRGSVLLKSEVGRQTTVEIRLPLTLAIIDGFLVRVAKNSYIIPLHEVVECIDADDHRMHANGDWSGNLDLRGEVLSFVDMRKIFGIGGIGEERRSIVVVKNGASLAGLVVDQLLGEYQTVIKPLGKLFQQLRGISGSTVLGSGEVALILDVAALIRLATVRESLELAESVP